MSMRIHIRRCRQSLHLWRHRLSFLFLFTYICFSFFPRPLTISTSSVLLFLLPRWLCIAPMPLPTHCKKMETHVASFEYPMQK